MYNTTSEKIPKNMMNLFDELVAKARAYIQSFAEALHFCDCSHCEDLKGNSPEQQSEPKEGCICTCTLCPCCENTASGRTVCDGPCGCCEDDS